MCGIVGVINEGFTTTFYESKLNRFFSEALFSGTLRGTDSTGLFLVEKEKNYTKTTTFKRALAAPDFLQLKITKNLLDSWGSNWSVMVGHNRAATKGKILDATSHPFTHNGITLVHNGTITNHRTLTSQPFEVDSEAITAAIAEDGIADVVKEIDGAFALVYHDEKAKVLNIIRNSERPLTLGFLKDKSGLLIASEAAMLHWIAVRNGLEVGEYVTPPPGTLFTFDVMGDKGWSQDPHKKVLELYRKVHPVSTVVTPKPVATDNNKNYFDTRETLLRSLDLVVGELMICKPVGFSEYTGRTGAGTLLCESIEDDIKDKMDVRIYSVEKAFFDSIDSEEYIESTVVNAYMDQVTKKIVVQLETANVDIVLLEEDEEEEITEDTKLYKGPFGLKLTKKEFDDHTKNGCVFCGSNIEPEDDITWESDLPLCKNCSNPDLYMFN